MFKNSAEVIVIGSGVMGTSTAHLARLGCCDVVLLEKDQPDYVICRRRLGHLTQGRPL